MTGQQDILLKLLRAALWNAALEGFTCSEDDWYGAYLLARRHALRGVLYDAVVRLPADCGIPQALAGRWRSDALSAEARYAGISRVADKQKETWTRRGINAVELKGRTVAAFYPVPSHRVSGDIDWWFPTGDDWDRALETVLFNRCTPVYDSDGDFHYQLGNVVVEHHRKGLELEGPLGILLMLNKHILHHAMGAGVGLRQVCDLAMALDRLEGSYDRAEYLRALSDRGLKRWNSVLEGLVAWIKEGGSVLPDDRRVRKLWKMVLTDGNFGHYKERRFSGFFGRAAFFAGIAPGKFLLFWIRLVAGHLKIYMAK